MDSRPDTLDLIGPDFDCEAAAAAERTLLICTAPRSGSYELCRLLTAAGIGVPHEYFGHNYSRRIANRWGMAAEPLAEEHLGLYIEMLRRRRSAGNVFAAKLMYLQFKNNLRNSFGAALFENATVVHLFRPDVVAQYASLRAAFETGRWGFSNARTSGPQPLNTERRLEQALAELDALTSNDAEFRRLFVLLGIRPLFVTTDELFADPARVVQRIADCVGASVNARGLTRMIALSKPYVHDCNAKSAVDAELKAAFRNQAFSN